MEEESNGELVLLETLLKQNNEEISLLVYMKSTNSDQYLHHSSHHQTSCKCCSLLVNRAYSTITKKDDFNKQNARIKHMLKENRYQENIGKILKGITNNHSLVQSEQLMQATNTQEEEIKMSINLPYFYFINFP